jgi:hypothetical protein
VLITPCYFRAVNTKLDRISCDRCRLPLANYMKLHLMVSSIPSALTIFPFYRVPFTAFGAGCAGSAEHFYVTPRRRPLLFTIEG